MKRLICFFALISAIYTLPVLAQGEDAYDPFVDYSEFEQASEEEADINFFRTGRFFTLNFYGGYQQMTSTQGTLFKPSTTFGLGLTYFFDLRFALQIAYLTSDHTVSFTSPLGTDVRGNINLQDLSVGLKYYFNTQNVTKGLADLNPYIMGAFSSNARTGSLSGQVEFSRDTTMGFDIAAGFEAPMLRNKMFFGAQIVYKIVTWPDENSEIIVNDTENTGIYPSGDVLTITGIIGVNF